MPRRAGVHAPGLEEAVYAGGGWRPVVVLGVIAGASLSQGLGLILMSDIGASIGLSGSAITSAYAYWAVAVAVAMPVGLWISHVGRGRRVSLAMGAALVALALTGTATATSFAGLVIAAGLGGGGTVLLGASLFSLLGDTYPNRAQVRLHALLVAIALLAAAGALTQAELIIQALGLNWRAGLFVVGLEAAVAALLTLTLAFPHAGVEAQLIHHVLGGRNGGIASPSPNDQLTVTLAMRRIHSIPSMRQLFVVFALCGATSLIVPVYGSFILEELHGVAASTVSIVLAASALVGALALASLAPRAEATFAVDVRRFLAWAATAASGAAVATLATGLAPGVVLPAAFLVIAITALALVLTAANHLMTAVLPPYLRSVGTVVATFYASAGLFAGALIGSAVDGWYGLEWSVAAAAGLMGAAAIALQRAGLGAARDVAREIDALRETEELAVAHARGQQAPLLTCRRVSFAYDQLQVLFNVDFSVEDGEMVALLGTNGAGKSTLLRVISGVGTPFSGSVRLDGRNITQLEPAERVALGISQVPGGKAVFGPLTVAENLRLYGYSLGRDRRALDRGIEAGFAAFPALAERRQVPASTLSGGEQQMLALTKALILKPRLLLIDELSLGLAPKVVGELLQMVREINAGGTAVVLVEQSINVALTLARHAYFMEKGAIQFDGRTADLLAKPDLVRSVFLRGVAAGLAG